MQNINNVTKNFCQWETKKESLRAGIKIRTGNKDMFHCQERESHNVDMMEVALVEKEMNVSDDSDQYGDEQQ